MADVGPVTKCYAFYAFSTSMKTVVDMLKDSRIIFPYDIFQWYLGARGFAGKPSLPEELEQLQAEKERLLQENQKLKVP